jgi:hypothetical protein
MLSSHSGDRSAAVFPMSAERRYRLPLAPGIVIVQLLLSSGIAFLLAPSVVALSISLSADPQCRLYQHDANQGVPIMNTYRRSGLRSLPRCHRCIPAHPAIRAGIMRQDVIDYRPSFYENAAYRKFPRVLLH